MSRPFYDEYAWAYDFIITQPVAAQCDFIAERLSRRGIARGARILDAGCGAGSHAIELARRGYVVTGLDLSPQLIAEAQRRATDVVFPVSFTVGDILDLTATASAYDAILCRGVLNDFPDETGRRKVFHSFANALGSGGTLILDVRDWETTLSRKTREPVFEKSADTPRGRLTFRSVTQPEPQTRRLLIKEQHTLRQHGVEKVSAYDFSMRCWTREELHERLTEAGFDALDFFGGYDLDVTAGASDRLVCVASKIEESS
jgi:SAM-dependent methyltransferase